MIVAIELSGIRMRLTFQAFQGTSYETQKCLFWYFNVFSLHISKCLEYVVDDGASYSPYVRPVIDNTKALDLNFGLTVASIDG